MPPTLKNTIAALIQRRKTLAAAYAQICADPASYSISGSVSATNQKMADLRAELAALDREIASILSGASAAGMTLAYPDYIR